MKGGKIAPALCNILGILILASVILTCVPIVVPRMIGYDVYNIISGSMEPSIPVGSLIYVEAAVPADIQEGEVIAYHGRGSTIAHRVVQNRLVEGEFVTKGDANPEEDLNAIPYTSLVGRVKYHIPWIGSFLAIYTSAVGRLYVICFAACGAMFNMLAGRLRSRARERRREEEGNQKAEEKQEEEGNRQTAERRKEEGNRQTAEKQEEEGNRQTAERRKESE